MTTPDAAPANSVRPAQWRQLATALRGLEDFDRFTNAMQAALSGLDGNWLLSWSREGDAPPLPENAASLRAPIEIEGRIAGCVALDPRRRFSAGDMHLLGDLADFMGAALGASLRARRDAERRGLLRLLLDQAPVGIAAFQGSEIIASNGLAERWLAELGTQWLSKGAQVHQGAVSGHLIFAEVRDVSSLSRVQVAVLHDLSAQQARLLESLQTAFYKARATGQPASFGILAAARQSGGVLFRSLGEIQNVLGDDVRVGPYDSSRIGMVFESRGPALRARLRRLHSCPAWESCGLSLVDLHAAANPEDVLHRATAAPQPIADFLRPRILVADESPSVHRAVQTVFEGRAEAVRIAPSAVQEQLLRADIDAALVDFASLGDDAAGLVRLVNDRAPGLRLVFSLPSPLSERPGGDLVSVSKPFSREELRRTLLPS